MQIHERIAPPRRSHTLTWLMLLGTVALLPSPASAQSWVGYGRGPQHTALAPGPSQLPQVIRWSTPVDLQAQHSSEGDLNAHYGSPAITAHNTVLVPVKTGAQGGFMVTAVGAGSGNVLWTMETDYDAPPGANWISPMGIVLSGADLLLAVPGAGGTVLVRTAPDLRRGKITRLSFLGMSNYNQDSGALNSAIQINTPLTYDTEGNLYFGYISSGAPLPGYPEGIPGGLARITRKGVGSFVTAAALGGDPSMSQVAANCAPALSNEGSSVYVAVNQGGYSHGYLCKAASATLQPQARVLLNDPSTGGPGAVTDDATSTPTVGPDGDVYYGVLEQNLGQHHFRGWLLHFDAGLQNSKVPGSFGWDDSPSIVPSRLVPSYKGSSAYLVLTKYNDYSGQPGGSGQNKVAILDPNATEPDPIIPTVQAMKEVITVLGPTPNEGQPGVREWCINSAAIDEANMCAVINSEDGHIYRWSFATNTLTQGLSLAPATGEPYTPTLIGPDGAVYAINDGKLFCCIAGTGTSSNGPAPGSGSNLARALPSIPAGAIPVALLGAAGLLLVLACVATRRRIRPMHLQPLYVRVKGGR